MSKVICDVCGTAFPETATQCPICGSAKAPSAQAEQQTTAYTYVKGGRFSKSNVRKRNSGKAASAQRRAPADRQSPRRSSGSSGEENANRALIVVVVLLLLAIVAVVVYIGVRLVGPADTPDDGGKPGQTQSTEKPDPGPSEIPCTSLQTTVNIELNKVGETWDIQVSKLPENTTDSVSFESADPTIATVDANGKVTAVAAGETTVTVKCGEKTSTCNVKVADGSTTDPDDPDDPDDPVDPDFVLALRKDDVSFSRYGETWNAYNGTVSAEEITWISDDPTICTVENGKVTAVGPGQTKIYAQYGDQTVECIIRCQNTVVKPDTDPNVKISTEDVTLTIGKDDSFTLTLTKMDEGQTTGTRLNVTWTASEDGIVTIDGNKITGVSAGQVTVSAVYEGKTYKCIVRVKAAE